VAGEIYVIELSMDATTGELYGSADAASKAGVPAGEVLTLSGDVGAIARTAAAVAKQLERAARRTPSDRDPKLYGRRDAR
jgi:hypothetical protein